MVLVPQGECILQREGTELRVIKADPRILICPEVLQEATKSSSPYIFVEGDLVKIHAANRTVIYRIGEYLPEHQAYVAEWPD